MKRHWFGIALVGLLFALAATEAVEEKYPDGKVKLKFDVDKDGRKDGPYLENYENGKPKIKAVYKADTFDGPYASFHENGKANISAAYKMGKLNGAYAERNEQGKIMLTATYRDGKLHGTLRHYDKGQAILAQAFKEGEPVFARSLEDIKATLAQLGTVPEAEQKADAETAERMAALRRLKAYRYLVGVPYANVELDREMNSYADAGAKICEKIGRLDHTPKNPGMPDADYKYAYTGTSRSNLAQGYKNLVKSVDGWMDDSDASNIDRVGHRRWCINPAMRKVGFGRSGVFSAMMAHDKSQPSVPDYDFISFPPMGYMPIPFFDARYGWNITFNPQKFKKLDSSVKVTIYDELDPHLNRTGGPLSLNYKNTENSPFGVPNCIIFRPDKLALADGKRCWVELDGIQTADGKPFPVRFLVIFVKLD